MFKKLFIVFSLLTLCLLPFSDTGHTEPTITFSDNTPTKFKVCVSVADEEDSDLDDRLQSFVKRELHALENFMVVSLDDRWQFRLHYSIMEMERENGTKTGGLVITQVTLGAVSKSLFKNYDFEPALKPVMFGGVSTAYWEIDNLLEYAIQTVGNFNEEWSKFLKK